MHPILFKLGFLTIYSYGTCLAFAFIVTVILACFEAKRQKINKDIIIDLCFYIIISGIIGARLFYIFANLKDYLKDPKEILMIQHGGLIFYGGLIFTIIVGLFFLKKKKLPVLKIADIISPFVILGHSIGRLGCFLNGCCYGTPTNLSWGIIFPKEAYSSFVYKDTPIHPVQLYEMLANFIIFLVLLVICNKKKYDGQVLGYYVLFYAIIRFFLEMIRGDNIEKLMFNLNSSQMVSIFLIIIVVIFLFVTHKIFFSHHKKCG